MVFIMMIIIIIIIIIIFHNCKHYGIPKWAKHLVMKML
jgi:hypothetical protein